MTRQVSMNTHTLFQYIFGFPVYPSKILLALYLSPVSSAKEIGEQSGISRGKVYQTVQFLESEGLVDRSERGAVKLNIDIVESRLREGINELNKIADNLAILKQNVIKEEREQLLIKIKDLEKLEERFSIEIRGAK